MFDSLAKLAGFLVAVMAHLTRGKAKAPPAPAQDAIDARIDSELEAKRAEDAAEELYDEAEAETDPLPVVIP